MTPPNPTVLLTGFDAFGGDALNPSGLAAEALHGWQVLGHAVVGATLPTVFSESQAELRRLLSAHRPAWVVCTGVAKGRIGLSLEQVALNLVDARIPDNRGAQPTDHSVLARAPAAYFTTLPVKAMRHALQQAGQAAELSQTAGTFVCNAVFFALMHALATRPRLRGAKGGFVHLPALPEQEPEGPAMALGDQVAALKIALQAALQYPHDRGLPSMALH